MWTAPEALASNAATDSGVDLFPALATDGSGVWQVVWQSGDTLGATISSDQDILGTQVVCGCVLNTTTTTTTTSMTTTTTQAPVP